MAITSMKVNASMNGTFKTDVACSHPFVIDQPKAAGGTDLGPNPLEIFLSSLAACACALGRIQSMQKRIKLRAMTVQVEGDIDKDFLMGMTQEGRAGFTAIRLIANIDADMTAEEKKAFFHEICERCPVADNIMNATVVEEVLQ